MILITTNGGETWEMKSSNMDAMILSDAFQIDANRAFVTAHSGRILYTSDAGNTWEVQESGTTNNLYSIFFSNQHNGIITGQFGTILRTATGGSTWINENHNSNTEISFNLLQNYPNPFNPSTNIKYGIAKQSFVILKVYDILGREVATLVKEYKPIGSYSLEFNGRDLPSGVYFYELFTNETRITKKMILLQ